MTGINQFIREYNTVKDKAVYLSKHITKTYVPYEEKITRCRNIIDLSMYKTVNDKQIFWLDTPLRYNLFVQTVLTTYTDIDLTDGKTEKTSVLDGFNALENAGIFTAITEAIGSDFNVFNTVFQMMVDDEMQHNSFQNYIDTKLEALGLVTDTILSSFEEMKENPKFLEFVNSLKPEN